MPVPYTGLVETYREIVPTLFRQVKDPSYHVKRSLPRPRARLAESLPFSGGKPDAEGWIEICAATDLGPSDVLRFDHGRKTYALIRDAAGRLFASDGICTHGNTHLSGGLVKDDIIECPKHNGRFISPMARPPVRPSAAVSPPIRWKSAMDAFISISSRPVGWAPAPGRPVNCVSSAIATLPPSSRSLCSNRSISPEASPLRRATTCNSTSPPTKRSTFVTSTFPSPTREFGRGNISSIWWRRIPAARRAATIIRSPAITGTSARCVSTSASPHLRPARIARPALARATSSISSRAMM